IFDEASTHTLPINNPARGPRDRFNVNYLSAFANKSALIQTYAAAWMYPVAELLGGETNSKYSKPGPTPQLQLRFEQVRRLPAKNRSLSSDSSILFRKLRRREDHR